MNSNKVKTLSQERRRKTILSIILAVICIIWVLPVLAVVINSFKVNTFVKTDTFALPLGEMWAGFSNFITGITLGNYIGALRNFSQLQDAYNCIYCIVDEHAITVRQNPADLRRRCLELTALYLASGIDPEKSILYCQSHVSAHAELASVMNCFCFSIFCTIGSSAFPEAI